MSAANPWMVTYSGRVFYPLSPSPNDVFIVDIAHALSHLCRYAGHTRKFYSVAEHSVLMALYLRSIGKSAAVQFEALMHDASEAYVNDLVKPLKDHVGEYPAIEERVQRAIRAHFLMWSAFPPAVKECDRRICVNEMDALLRHPPTSEPMDIGLPGVRIRCWSPRRARRRFMRLFSDLMIETGRA